VLFCFVMVMLYSVPLIDMLVLFNAVALKSGMCVVLVLLRAAFIQVAFTVSVKFFRTGSAQTLS